MSESTKETLKKVWDKISLAALKAFRGLVCEKKNGGWELSKGRTAFWVVFTHCMYVWNGGTKAAKTIVSTVLDTATATKDAVVESTTALDTVVDTVGALSTQTGVSEQEFYLLLALLGYSAVKTTKGGLTSAMSALRGNK